MDRVAIIGFGCAGYHCAKTLREQGFEGEIHVFSDGALPPANPMLTTYYIAGKLTFSGMFPFGPLEQIMKELRLTLHPDCPVAHLCAPTKELTLEDGSKLSFDHILIATGAKVFVPPMKQMPKENIYYMRTPADAVLLKERLAKGDVKRAVVVGASMVGIKVAEIFNNRDIDCTLADLATCLFPLAAVQEVGDEIGARITRKGIHLKLGMGLSGIEPMGNGLRLHFGQEIVDTDIVLLAIGTRADVGVVDSTEIAVDRGILVNEKMETSAPDIYAAGDCASGNNLQSGQNQIIGLWANAGYQGITAGAAMLGKPVSYPGNMLHNITHFMGMDFIGFGDCRAQGEVLRYHQADFFLYAVRKEGKLALVNIVDNHAISGIIKNYMTRKFMGCDEPISPMQQVILLRNGLTPAVIAALEQA